MEGETTVCTFHTTNKQNPPRENFDMLMKGEIDSLLIAAQDKGIRTNYAKARIDQRYQKSTCRLCGNGDERSITIKEYCKLAKKKKRV